MTSEIIVERFLEVAKTIRALTQRVKRLETQSVHVYRTSVINFVIEGDGAVIRTGTNGDIEIPFDCEITGVTLLANQSGSIVVDIWKDEFSNYPPTNADSITASTPPTLAASDHYRDTTLTDWLVDVSAGDTLRFNVDSVSSITRLTISLKLKKK